MNIIPSIYTIDEIEKFEKEEIKKVGKENIKLVNLIEKSIFIFSIIGILPLFLFMYLFNNQIIGFFISLAYMVIWGFLMSIIIQVGEFNLYKLTIKMIKKKKIYMSSIISQQYFKHLCKEHKTLCEIYEFIQKHPNAIFKYNYPINGWVYIVYTEGIYAKEKSFKLQECYINNLFNKDSIDCSYCDKELEKCLNYKKKDEINEMGV